MHNIYKCDPVLEWLPDYKRNDPYHCMNWTFRLENGYMVDTYFNDTRIKVTPENENKFKFVCDLDKYHEVHKSEYELYSKSDKVRLALDSGGLNGAKYFVRNGAVKDLYAMLEQLKGECSSITYKIEHDINEISRLYMYDAWIPVTASLPKIGEDVLIQDENGNFYVAHLEEFKDLITKGYIWSRELDSSVVAWNRCFTKYLFWYSVDNNEYPEVNQEVFVQYKNGIYGVDWIVDKETKVWGADGYPDKVAFWNVLPERYEA